MTCFVPLRYLPSECRQWARRPECLSPNSGGFFSYMRKFVGRLGRTEITSFSSFGYCAEPGKSASVNSRRRAYLSIGRRRPIEGTTRGLLHNRCTSLERRELNQSAPLRVGKLFIFQSAGKAKKATSPDRLYNRCTNLASAGEPPTPPPNVIFLG